MTVTADEAREVPLTLGRDLVLRMRLPGPPKSHRHFGRIGSLASAASRFSISISRPVATRRALRGPEPVRPHSLREVDPIPPRWWQPGLITHPTPKAIPKRTLPRAVHSAPNGQTYQPGGIVNGLVSTPAPVRRMSEVAAAGPMLTSHDKQKLHATRARSASAPPPPPRPSTSPRRPRSNSAPPPPPRDPEPATSSAFQHATAEQAAAYDAMDDHRPAGRARSGAAGTALLTPVAAATLLAGKSSPAPAWLPARTSRLAATRPQAAPRRPALALRQARSRLPVASTPAVHNRGASLLNGLRQSHAAVHRAINAGIAIEVPRHTTPARPVGGLRATNTLAPHQTPVPRRSASTLGSHRAAASDDADDLKDETTDDVPTPEEQAATGRHAAVVAGRAGRRPRGLVIGHHRTLAATVAGEAVTPAVTTWRHAVRPLPSAHARAVAARRLATSHPPRQTRPRSNALRSGEVVPALVLGSVRPTIGGHRRPQIGRPDPTPSSGSLLGRTRHDLTVGATRLRAHAMSELTVMKSNVATTASEGRAALASAFAPSEEIHPSTAPAPATRPGVVTPAATNGPDTAPTPTGHRSRLHRLREFGNRARAVTDRVTKSGFEVSASRTSRTSLRLLTPAPPRISVQPSTGSGSPAARARAATVPSTDVAIPGRRGLVPGPDGRLRPSLVDSTAALFAAAAAAGRWTHGHHEQGSPMTESQAPTELTRSTGPAVPASARTILDDPAALEDLVDEVVERIEARVVDELERRGRRYNQGAF